MKLHVLFILSFLLFTFSVIATPPGRDYVRPLIGFNWETIILISSSLLVVAVIITLVKSRKAIISLIQKIRSKITSPPNLLNYSLKYRRYFLWNGIIYTIASVGYKLRTSSNYGRGMFQEIILSVLFLWLMSFILFKVPSTLLKKLSEKEQTNSLSSKFAVSLLKASIFLMYLLLIFTAIQAFNVIFLDTHSYFYAGSGSIFRYIMQIYISLGLFSLVLFMVATFE
ncbi:hypothetical protein HYX00_05665 [Candidatus Woesearchaeota archaeon]|nr:hypothetical protein [Candidatus Woesearchaeota archaeon]